LDKKYTYPQKINVNILVSFFSFVSGTNHLVQYVAAKGWFGNNTFKDWIGRGYFWIRQVRSNIDDWE